MKKYHIMAFFGFHFAQLTNSFCSFHSDFWIFFHSTLKFLICPCKMSFSTSLLFILCRWDVMCLQRQWQKKFTNLNLKEIQHEAEKKNWSSFKLCIKHAVVTFFFFVFWNWDLKTHVSYDVEMQCLYRTMSLNRLLQDFRPIK